MKAIKTFLLILGLIAVCSGVQADITGSNLMLADNTNTVRTSDDSSDWYSTSPASNQWNDRGVGGTFVAAVDPVLGAIDVAYQGNAPASTEIRSMISGLAVGTRYHVWVLTALTTDNLRSINAAFDDGSELTTYGVANATDTGLITHSTDWILFEGYLGAAVVDANGEINVLVAYSGAERSVYHGVAYSPALNAWNPSPADEAERVFPEDDPSLDWDGTASGSLTEHIVYMAIFDDPNENPTPLIEVARTDAGVTEWNPSGAWELQRDMHYYWRVDENLGGEIIAGEIWHFSTASSFPEIEGISPETVHVDLTQAEDAVFTVTAANPFTRDPVTSDGLSYQWYKAPGEQLSDGADYGGTATDTLTVKSPDAADEASYFCRVTIDSNQNGEDSPMGYLAIDRMVGHWKLDGNANDEFGNDGIEVNRAKGLWYAADTGAPPNDPNEPIIGSGCLRLNNWGQSPDDPIANSEISYVKVPHIDAYSDDVFTVSCWIKNVRTGYSDQAGAGYNSNYWGSLVSKTDAAGTNPGWALRRNDWRRTPRWYTYGSPGLNSDAGAFIDGGEWYHLVGVYDEVNNTKSFYVNGLVEVSVDDLGADTGLLVADGKLCIGADIYGTNGPRSPGEFLLDDVRLYNYALDKFEIGQIYADGADESICVEYPAMDIDGDCDVDLDDLKLFVADWLQCGLVGPGS